ncbi:MAG: ATPase family associated with various cellular activities (AAA) [Candidatus Argoarchaeum ethanivorans]|uniref:ATPase family associated with various cellular activities (AAA) n=1 Tax=Candidatus Argoarchaeum ethanivorans TaxID=2608793 RepID=A0A811T716_9EURY|nr:MAG: ATPase family associated with various cellular activities (AAA) [Candidatus Argoarchaeum ethanivorans]
MLIVTKNERYSDNLIKDKVLELIFNEQFDATGLLPIGHVVNNDFVITNNNQIEVRKVSANPILSSVECFNDLLTHESLETDLERYQDHFKLTYEWIMKRLRKDSDNRFLGWYPEYESTHTPESWVGGHALLFLKNYCEMLSKLIKKSACKYLQCKKYRELKTLDITWDKLYDSYEIKKYIGKCMGNKASDYRSALIFGPPGSGKSTIPKALAKKLEWDYVELTPGLFLAKGDRNIISEANNIFKRLKRMKDTVIFFDEVDELVKSREKYTASAWIVTALLPEFADLWKRKEIKFILATNDITKVDSAAMRGGRIDLVLPMGGICWKNRLKILEDAIDNSNGNSDIKRDLKTEIFGELWDKDVDKIDVDKIDKNNMKNQGAGKLKNFLERTDFVPVIEIKEIIRELFKEASIKNIKNRQQFKIFFEGIGGIGNFENGEFKKFHDDLLSKLYPNIKLPSTERAEETEDKKYIKDIIIEGNTF